MKHIVILMAALSSTIASAQLLPSEYTIEAPQNLVVGIDYNITQHSIDQIPEPLLSVATGAVPGSVRIESVDGTQLVAILPSGERMEVPIETLMASTPAYMSVREIPIQGAAQLPCGFSLSHTVMIIPRGEAAFTGEVVYALRHIRSQDTPHTFFEGGPHVTCSQFLEDISFLTAVLSPGTDLDEAAIQSRSGEIDARYGAEASGLLTFLVSTMILPMVDAGLMEASELTAQLKSIQLRMPLNGRRSE